MNENSEEGEVGEEGEEGEVAVTAVDAPYLQHGQGLPEHLGGVNEEAGGFDPVCRVLLQIGKLTQRVVGLRERGRIKRMTCVVKNTMCINIAASHDYGSPSNPSQMGTQTN